MADDLTVVGAEELAKIGTALRRAPKEIKREFYIGVSRAVKPLTMSVKQALPQFVPDAYAAELAKSLKTKTRSRSGSTPSVTLISTAKTKRGKVRNLAALNKGRLRKPLFGDRRFWFDQSSGVRPDFFAKPAQDNVDEVREELLRVFEDVAKQIVRWVD